MRPSYNQHEARYLVSLYERGYIDGPALSAALKSLAAIPHRSYWPTPTGRVVPQKPPVHERIRWVLGQAEEPLSAYEIHKLAEVDRKLVYNGLATLMRRNVIVRTPHRPYRYHLRYGWQAQSKEAPDGARAHSP